MQTLTYLSSYLLLWSLSIQFIHMHCASWDAAWQILREISLFDCWSLWAGYLSVLPTWWTPDRCTLPWMTSSVKSYENSVLGQTMPRSHLQYKFCINKQFPQKYTTGTFFKLLMNWVSKYQPGRNIGSILAFPWLIDVAYSFVSLSQICVCVCQKSILLNYGQYFNCVVGSQDWCLIDTLKPFSNIIRSTVVTCVPSHVQQTHSDWTVWVGFERALVTGLVWLFEPSRLFQSAHQCSPKECAHFHPQFKKLLQMFSWVRLGVIFS